MDNTGGNTYEHEAENKSFSPVTIAESGAKYPSQLTVSYEALKARREYAVGLKIAGMSVSTIVLQINEVSDVKQWGKVHRGIVEKDISQYYRETAPLREGEYDHLEQMRNVHISQMEATVEKMAIMIAKKAKNDSWKPFEEADAIEKYHKMQMNLAELHDWNMGRKNPLISFTQNDVTQIYDAAAIAIVGTKDKSLIDGLVSELKGLSGSMKEQEQERLTNSEKNVIEVTANTEKSV